MTLNLIQQCLPLGLNQHVQIIEKSPIPKNYLKKLTNPLMQNPLEYESDGYATGSEFGSDDENEMETEIPFQKVGKYLHKYFASTSERTKGVILEVEDGEYIVPVKLMKFYNTFGDIPVKISIEGKVFIFKLVNSLEDDYCCMEMFKILNKEWKKKKVNASIPVYDIIPLHESIEIDQKKIFVTGGFIEFVVGNAMMNVSSEHIIALLLNSKNKEEKLNNFISSLVGGTVGNWIVGLYDRHQYNVIFTPDAKIAHIDLNMVFGIKSPFDEIKGLNVKLTPAIYLPKRLENVLKDPSINKYQYFVDEVKKAYENLPSFEEVCKALKTDGQRRFVHEKMYNYSYKDILSTNFVQEGLRTFRDKMSKIFTNQKDVSVFHKKEDECVHIICKNIYLLNRNGLAIMEKSTYFLWETMYIFCKDEEEGYVYMVSYLTQRIYSYNSKTAESHVISSPFERWGNVKALQYWNGHLYIFAQKLSKMNVNSGKYVVLNNSNWIKDIVKGVVHYDKLFLFTKENEVLYVFDPSKKKIFSKICKEMNFPKNIKNSVLVSYRERIIIFGGGHIYIYNPSSDRVDKVTKKKLKHVKAAAKMKKSILVVGKKEILLFDPVMDTIKKLEIPKKSWKKTTLAF